MTSHRSALAAHKEALGWRWLSLLADTPNE
jgi:hypothetical protein